MDPYLLHLPTTRIIDDSFKIRVEQESMDDNLNSVIRVLTIFKVSTTYLVKLESIEFKNYKQIPGYDMEEFFEHYKAGISQSNLSLLNQIEYLLSVPIKDLALHLNEDSDLDKLVYWRYSLPTRYPVDMNISEDVII